MKHNGFTLQKRFLAVWTKQVKIIFLLLLALVLWYFVSATAAFFWTIFIAFIIFKLDSTIIAQAALMCLVMLPILLATGKDGVAEQVAVYAYFLLTMTVGLQIIELKTSPENNNEINPPLKEMTEGRGMSFIKIKLKKIVTDINLKK